MRVGLLEAFFYLLETTLSEASVISKCHCRQDLPPGLNSTSGDSSFDQQSMEAIVGEAGRDCSPLHMKPGSKDESRLGYDEVLPSRTSFSGPNPEPKVAHAFTLVLSDANGHMVYGYLTDLLEHPDINRRYSEFQQAGWWLFEQQPRL